MAARPSLSATPSSLGKMAVIASALGLAACGANEEREPDAVADVTPDDVERDESTPDSVYGSPPDVEQDVVPDDDTLPQPLYGEPTDDVVPGDVYGSPPDVQPDDVDDDASADTEPDIQVEPAYGIPPEDAGLEPDADAADGSADVDSDIDIPMPEYGIPPEP